MFERGLECNYQYYVKIEKGIAFPSSILINQLAKALKRTDGEEIIRSYCREQFESFSYLFASGDAESPVSLSHGEDPTESKKKIFKVEQGQKELTIKQVATLKKKKENYFLFLIVTLSRGPVPLDELTKFPQVKSSIKDLSAVGIIGVDNKLIKGTSSEFKFPKTSTPELDLAYKQFDSWDVEFANQFGFKNYLNKMMIRRISPRYFNVMLKQIEAFTDFVRCSDESDQKYNKDVLHLHIRINKGELPG